MRYLLDTNICVMYLIGTSIGICDLQIAAIALANNLTLTTCNTQELDRVDGWQIEDLEVTL
jgi:tRNA(fMet)-specific endonuclease VapC